MTYALDVNCLILAAHSIDSYILRTAGKVPQSIGKKRSKNEPIH